MRRTFWLALLIGGLFASAASAGPIVDVLQLDIGAHKFVTVTRNGLEANTAAGQFTTRFSNDPGAIIRTFCVDFDHSGPVPYKVEVRSTNDGLASGPDLAHIYNKYGASELSDNVLAAAIQVAMWDLVDDGGDGLLNGFFQYLPEDQANDMDGAAIAAKAQELINEALGAPGSETSWYDASLNGDAPDRGQNIIGGPPKDPPGEEIPEPATIVLLGLGVAGLSLAGWRSKAKWLRA